MLCSYVLTFAQCSLFSLHTTFITLCLNFELFIFPQCIEKECTYGAEHFGRADGETTEDLGAGGRGGRNGGQSRQSRQIDDRDEGEVGHIGGEFEERSGGST